MRRLCPEEEEGAEVDLAIQRASYASIFFDVSIDENRFS
jgi:hypothetical protein